jgi:hypothetical protein
MANRAAQRATAASRAIWCFRAPGAQQVRRPGDCCESLRPVTGAMLVGLESQRSGGLCSPVPGSGRSQRVPMVIGAASCVRHADMLA